ncbi:MAG: NAD(P)/FAD-dependent oxidoreductase [Parahaliea sp.]
MPNSHSKSNSEIHSDVLIIGAGPSGAIASALLVKRGYSVTVLEREQFPRFSIGESLLPQCMEYIEEAGMLDAVRTAAFQHKNGALFQYQGTYGGFDFGEQFSSGFNETYQVQRADFDKLLADEAARMGANILYRHETVSVDLSGPECQVNCRNTESGEEKTFTARFLLDASGFGRVLPRLLDLEQSSDFPVRSSLFTHIEDHISAEGYDRDKIIITVHPNDREVWFWLIPFSNGRCSIGVVARPEFYQNYSGADELDNLRAIVAEDPELSRLLADASWDTPASRITGYSCNVSQMCSNRFALLGNAGEFLDPVFSSGVTIAMRSSSMAVAVLDKQLQGEVVDWQKDYAEPLAKGVNTFKTFVEAWYDKRFQDVIFHDSHSPDIRSMICSILAGYAWDEGNPYVAQPERRLNTLWQYCQQAKVNSAT